MVTVVVAAVCPLGPLSNGAAANEQGIHGCAAGGAFGCSASLSILLLSEYLIVFTLSS